MKALCICIVISAIITNITILLSAILNAATVVVAQDIQKNKSLKKRKEIIKQNRTELKK